MFPNKGCMPMDTNNLYHRDWKGLLRRAGLAETFTFHTCRHTFATTLLRQNVNPKIVQHQLGHATISQTMDTYSHVMPEMGDVAADGRRHCSRSRCACSSRRRASAIPEDLGP